MHSGTFLALIMLWNQLQTKHLNFSQKNKNKNKASQLVGAKGVQVRISL